MGINEKPAANGAGNRSTADIKAGDIDPEEIASILRACAAEYIMPRFQALATGDVNTKSGPGDLVTIADIETEEALERILEEKYPGAIVVGEEGVSAGTKDLSVLQAREGIVFVADPVDGTGNFVQGRKTFCVMLACVVDGVTEYGWIYDPKGERMLIAARGRGTTINGTKVHVAMPKPLKESYGYGHPFFFPKRLRHHFDTLKKSAAGIGSLRCSGHEYLCLASGEKDFSISAKPKPWDHLAGALAVTEAGGVALHWDGSPYKPQDMLGGIVVASHQGLFNELEPVVLKDMRRDLASRHE